MGDWVFGCDVCQEVCPWNRKAPAGREAVFQRDFPTGRLNLVALLEISEEEFRQRFRHSPLWRPRRDGMRRNAAIALGNLGDPAALPALERAARDADPTVRDAAQWAVERIRVLIRGRLIPVSDSSAPPAAAPPRPAAIPDKAVSG